MNDPIPDSVFDRFYAEHPEETDHRGTYVKKVSKRAPKPEPGETMDAFLARTKR